MIKGSGGFHLMLIHQSFEWVLTNGNNSQYLDKHKVELYKPHQKLLMLLSCQIFLGLNVNLSGSLSTIFRKSFFSE